MKRSALAVLLVIAVGAVWRFPLFHVVRLDALPSDSSRAELNATELAESFWSKQLLPSLDQSADAAAVVAVLRKDAREAGERFGRSIGIGRVRLVCLRGTGTIVSVDM